MKDNIQGSISIRISDDEMVAWLDYEPSQVIFEWSEDVILELLDKAGVKKGFKTFKFSRIYSRIKLGKNKESFEIARGIAPVSEEHGAFNLRDKIMSSTLKSVFNDLLDKADKPKVYSLLDDFTFGEQQEQISNVVLNSYYVDEQEIIADIVPQGKSIQGYTVSGKELNPSKEDAANSFFISKDFIVQEDKVYSVCSGFVRVGKNWVDLIPFKGPSYSLSPSDDYSEYYLTFSPGSKDVPVPAFSDLIALFNDIDYPLELLKSENVILKTLQRSISEKKSIKISLTKKKKAVSSININQSKTRATLILEKGAGPGERLSLKNIGELIRKSEIKGMNLDSLKKQILDFYKSKKLKLEYVVLEGKTGTRGKARHLKYQKEFVPVDSMEGIVERISTEIETFYLSFKKFKKEDINSAIIVKSGFDFAVLTESVVGDDGVDIYGKKINGLSGNDPIIKTFENIAIKHDKFISEIDGILDIGEVNGEIYLRIREHKDMFVDVSLSKDAMSASFTFYKEEGSGESASVEFILQQIESAGIVKGIDQEIVKDSYKRYMNGELISEVIFATGEIPSDKKSSRIKYFNNSKGLTDFSYEIEKGGKIAQIFPTKEKVEDGFDVIGTIMESSGIVSLDLKISDTILEEKLDDGSVILTSDINGELKVNESEISIIDKKVLSGDVSAKTGSIKTLCSLVVKGNVDSSLYVVSGGNIKIMGTVQGALISADKNIIIIQGVKGEEKAVIRAKEKIDVKFIENANMMAVNDIHIRKAALHTKIISNGKILFDKNGSKLVGGETYAKNGMLVDELGSPSGGKTIVSFGQDYLVADKIKVFEGDVEKIQQDLIKLDQIFNKPGSGLSPEKITHLRKQKVFLMKKLEKKNMKLFLLREKFEEHSKSEILIRNKIYPGVVFESHGRKLEIMDEEPMCKIIFNLKTGQIEKHH